MKSQDKPPCRQILSCLDKLGARDRSIMESATAICRNPRKIDRGARLMHWPMARRKTAILAVMLSLWSLLLKAEQQIVPTVKGAENIYAVLCTDEPGKSGLREQLLSDHLSFVEAHFDRYRVAGPLYDQGGDMTRSLFIIRADSLADAKAFMAQDPYVAGGLYEEIEYRRFLPAVGDWIGGKVWDERPAD